MVFTPQTLKSYLITVLGSELGTFRTPGGKTYPSIWISPPMIDPSWVCEGLQVIIFDKPEVQGNVPLIGERLKRQWWIIELTQFDTSKSLAAATTLIENVFLGKITTRQKRSTRIDYEESRLGIFDPVVIGNVATYTNPNEPLPTPPSAELVEHNLDPNAHPNGIAGSVDKFVDVARAGFPAWYKAPPTFVDGLLMQQVFKSAVDGLLLLTQDFFYDSDDNLTRIEHTNHRESRKLITNIAADQSITQSEVVA